MKRKESVVVFKGEDQFILPRTRTYDLKSGKSEFVGLVDDNTSSGDKKDPYGYNIGNFIMPDLADPLFCEKIKEFINSKGNDKATPEEIMNAYKAFSQYCKGNPAMDTSSTTETTTETTTQTTTSTTTSTTTLPVQTTTQGGTLASEAVSTQSIFPSNLGMPPKAASEKKDEKQESGDDKYKIILYVVLGLGVLGGVAYYLSRRNN